MQKLSGTSSVKNNKSCEIFHHESNKIGFAFFLFFYEFLRHLQESAKWFYYLSYQFARRPSERSFALQCCPCGGQRQSGGNSDRGSPDSGWGGWGSGLGLTRARVRWLEGGRAAPASGLGGAGRHLPPGCQRRRVLGLGAAVGGSSSSRRG
jgi:hypothetical protein